MFTIRYFAKEKYELPAKSLKKKGSVSAKASGKKVGGDGQSSASEASRVGGPIAKRSASSAARVTAPKGAPRMVMGVRAHAHVCVCARTHTHANTHRYTHRYTHTHAHTHTHTHTHTRAHTHTRTHTHARMHTMCVHIQMPERLTQHSLHRCPPSASTHTTHTQLRLPRRRSVRVWIPLPRRRLKTIPSTSN
jgi:hypothetical protein